ncbi:non-ribosomal peptide synthase/polyketide synthase [Brevibacillus dissolubilis]|uniref:non-ribosomal peptide synthetase n=1 Tax=Brevibacillus dissolubilis TaxID=1844116 RepID=UPI00159BA51E|nr:non-ribosomal peptide synthase/polyketide synthase [Brevibacillus dissolubilis]
MASNKVANIYPLSPMQEGMLFHSLLDKGTEAYFEQLRINIQGDVDTTVLEASLNALIARYDSLRTVFIHEKVQKPRQIVLKERTTQIQVHDISALDEAAKQSALDEYIRLDRQKGFDLSKDVLIRLSAVKTSADAWLLIWSHHHIIMDGWCIPIILNDFFTIYGQLRQGAPLRPEPVYPYSTYIEWLEEQDKDEAKRTWHEYISDCEPTVLVPSAGVSKGHQQAERVFVIDEKMTGGLSEVAKKYQVTLNSLFQTIWGLMLQRYSNTPDAVFGSVVSGRPAEVNNVEKIVGLFINTVPVRVQSSPEQRFTDILQQVQQASLSLESYHYLSLADIQAKNQNLIDHILLFQNFPMGPEFLGRLNDLELGYQIEGLDSFEQTNYDLNVMIIPSQVLTIKYIYNATTVSEAFLTSISEHLTAMMEQIIATPEMPVRDLQIVTEAESRTLLDTFNDTHRDYPTDQQVHEKFAQYAGETPDEIALVMQDTTLTYREVNEKANQLARHLRERGVGPESIVAMLTDRSPEMIIAILAIFKAGGAYLPIDPTFPRDRVEYILHDSGAKLLLTQNRYLGHAEFGDQVIDLEAAELYQGDALDLPTVQQRDNLAYVIYTSGSTGKPKGVMIEHASLTNVLYALQELYPFAPDDAYLLKTTYTFDVSVAEIFGWIMGHGRLVILAPGAEKDPRQMWDTIASKQVTHTNFVPSMLIPFIDYVQVQPQANRLKYIFAAGEAMPAELVDKVYEALPDVKLENIYGPTESTIYATYYSLPRTGQTNPVPIGKPLPNIQMHIISFHDQLQPVGVPGELCIAGAGLARGYLKNEALTDEKFVPHPFNPGEKLYKTGDLARYTADGTIEYLGRIDHQVKIRGYRIELDEIRTKLIQADSIRDAIVVARNDHQQQAYLCAYLISDRDWTVGALREYLRNELPEYMIPAYFVRMEQFPLTSSGKIDRKALPEPDGSVQTGVGYTAPRNPVEELVASIWSQILSVERVGIHDNFFELGGHSLFATQMLSRIVKSFQIDLPLRDIFTCPTVAELAERIQYVRSGGAGRVEATPIQPIERGAHEGLPLSYAQQRLWFFDRLLPNSAMYNIPVGFRLRGALSAKLIEQSLNEIVRRHESLRTTFSEQDGHAVQFIHDHLPQTLPFDDVRGLSPAERDEHVKQLALADAAKPFDISEGPLMRAHLIQLEDEEFILLLNMHHIISDGWSMDILVDELGALYDSYAKGQEPALSELPIQYADFAAWQRGTLQNEVVENQLGYWKKQLGGAEPILPLPTDRPRPPVQSYQGSQVRFTVPREVALKLHALSRQEGVTLYMTLLAAFKSLLYRYTSTEDIIVGTPVAGRNRQDIEGLIGFFVNTLALRTQMSGESTFLDVMSRVRETAFDAFSNQDVPFEKLVDELQLERSLSYSPLFQVMFSVQNASTGVREQDTISIQPLEFTANQTSKFDLSLTMIEGEDGMQGVLEYSTDLFDTTTVERMAGHMSTLLTSIVQQPKQKIGLLPIMQESEKAHLLQTLNHTDVATAAGATDASVNTVLELFQKVVAQHPNQPAVLEGSGSITYDMLDRRANQLAHYLQKQGIGSESLVGICVERSVEMFVGLLGIIKAGGAYVPMDPAYPQDRLAYMMQDAQMQIVLTQERLLDKLPEGAAKLICLDRDYSIIAEESEQAPETKLTPESLAYVIYTSGSTGLPKGVEIEHGSLLHLVRWHQRAYDVTPADHATQMAGTAFDASVWEIWPYLTKGAAIHLPPEEIRLSPEQLRDWMVEKNVTISFLPTALAENMLTLDWPTDTALRYLLTGGDKLHQYPAPHLPFTLINHYGPTENTVVATAGIVPVQAGQTAAPTIGRPIDHVQVYVLDDYRQPVPIGVVGELYIGGGSVARGYLNRPDLTAERFVADPFAGKSGASLYRTGDLVRYLADGTIEFIGRADNQVSIRGFRVELGEIETALYAQAGIRETVVTVREDMPGNKRLIAYIVLDAGQEIEGSSLRLALKETLPDYMVPSAFVIMDSLPLTPNGKVDRKALPVPDYSTPGLDGAFIEPTTLIEKQMAEIWKQVLGVEQIGVHDNFFELGGDSILCIQIVSKAKQSGLLITPKHVFDHQTIAELAVTVQTVEEKPQVLAEQSVVTGEVPFTPIQKWFVDQEHANIHHWNQSVMLAIHNPLDPAKLEKALAALLQHHDALRLRIQQVNGVWEQVNAGLTDTVPLQVENLADLAVTEQESRMREIADEAQASLNLTDGPLVRAVYFQSGTGHDDRLFIAIHHMAVDGVSWRIIMEDLQLAYQQVSNGQEVRLPAKTTSFKQWSEQLTAYAQTVDLPDYWNKLDATNLPTLTADHAEGFNTEADTVQITLALDAEETQALLQEIPSKYRTQMNDVLLSALTKVICGWTNQNRLYLTMEGHGREGIIEGADLSRTVGWFTSMYPVLLRMEPAKTWGDTLKSVKEQLRQIPDKGITYGISRYLRDQTQEAESADADHQSLPQPPISFNYLGQFGQARTDEAALYQLIPNWSDRNVYGAEQRAHLIDVNSSIMGDQLQVTWMYSRATFQSDTLEKLAHEYMQALREIIAHCRTEEAGGYTASDFPLARLNQRSIDRYLGQDRQIENVYPLTPLQEGMLFHSLYAQDGGDYVVQLAMKCSTKLDVEAFEQAWQKVVERHAILRTSFIWEGLEQPHQIVRKNVSAVIEHHDWRGVPEAEREEKLQAYLADDRKRSFDITTAPLMRWALIRFGDDEYRFVWSFHHVLLDGWSTPLVLGDWQTYYRAIVEGREAGLGAVPPFAHYIAWLQGRDQQEAQEYWHSQLRGFTTPTPLGMGRAGSTSLQEKVYAEQSIYVPADVTNRLQSFARTYHVTFNTLVQGAWALILSRYSGEQDILFGATGSGRPTDLAGVQDMIGLFINTLPLRVWLDPEDTVLNWLTTLQNNQLEMRQYEFTSLVDVQGWSDMPRGTSLFDSILVFENYLVGPIGEQQELDLDLTDVQAVEQTNYPLTLVASPGAETLLKLIYDTNRFDPSAVEKVLTHLSIALEEMVREPQQKLSSLTLVSEEEQHKLLVEWNHTAQEYSRDLMMHQLVERQAERTPDEIALIVGEERLTYNQLNQRANQLAHYLRKQGIGPEVLVGVCTERTVEMIVGLLAIIKAGGAYVPIDPAYPQDRIAYMLADAKAPVLLTQESLVAGLPQHQAQIIRLDTDWEQIALQPTDNLENQTKINNLAYVIYTSGSTGNPKGVAIEHRSVIAFLAWAEQTFSAEEMQGVLAVTSICFDLSVFEIFSTLSRGGKLILADNALHLASLPAADEVTLINTVPSAARELLRIDAIPTTVRVVNLAGEPLSNTLSQQLYERDHIEKVYNLYGPSEDTTYSTYSLVQKGADTEPTIGRPLSNTQVYILDAHMQPVPAGLPGELYIAGDGLARGYLHRPDLTAERFLPNPFSTDPQARMYKTGDLVRYLPDTQIEYLGRIDHQVKVRGYRIELGELEAVLRQHPVVQEAVVMARENPTGDKRLVAYLTASEDQTAEEIKELNRWLKAKLPEFMVPSLLVWLEAMPLTPNGKIDRKLLPEPDWSAVTTERGYVAPRNPMEEMIATIWSDILLVPQVGIHDNFFELGGHSLLATQVVSRLREAFGVNVQLRTLFEQATVAELSRRVASLIQGDEETALTPIPAVSREQQLPLSFAQQRLWFFDRFMPEHALYNIPGALRLSGNVNIEAWRRSLEAIIARHESLRTTFTDHDGHAVQVIHPDTDWTLELVDLRDLASEEQEAEVQRLMAEDARRPFDLGHGPLLRTSLIRIGEEEYIFLFNMHHIISDGWSIGVFLRELTALYEAFCQGEEATLTALPIQYADFAAWQREWLSGETLEQQLAYWKQKLSGSEPVLQLPTDRPRPAAQSYEGAQYTVLLPKDLLHRLQTLSRNENATLFMTLLAAYQTLLYRYSGQPDILVGSPVAGRNRQETEGLIGFFVNTLVLRTDLSGEPTFRELLARVRETSLEAYAHQDLPFEKLVDELQLERSLSYSPLFQVMFVLQNFDAALPETAGVSLTPFDNSEHLVTSKFDLTLTMYEEEDGLRAMFEYNTALFDAETITRMTTHFDRLLNEIAVNPERSIDRLPLLSTTENETLLTEWSQTSTNELREKTVDQLFHEAATNWHDRPAIAAGDETISYAELERRANQVANYLCKMGVGTGSLVGISAERSVEMIAGLLGILKAGGAYVPLDPAYPQERLAYMMEDAQVSILLTQADLIGKLPVGERTVICLDRDWNAIAQESTEAPSIEGATSDRLAYVIYTSGSTGTPKGVLTPHRGIVRLVTNTNFVTISEKDVFLQASTVSFDAATFEIWGALLNGAKLVLMPPHLPSLEEIGEAVQKHQVTTMWLTAGLFTLLVDTQVEYLRGVRQLLVGGDVVSVPHVRKALTIDGLQIINGYGPTETTTFACCYPVTELPEQMASLPIGRPIQNTSVYILDKHMQPVPTGVPGELYIGGAGLALGYLNNPDMTAERFVADPFSDNPQARLYKTGDLVRYLPDGTIEFIGRIDQQVKIRGFRIELGEIETLLVKHPAVQDAVVIVRQDDGAKKQLVAYVVAESEAEVRTQELRLYFKEHLPDYMIPSAFVLMDTLPLTPNGKVDRKALPAPVIERVESDPDHAEPLSQIEQKLTEIWCAVLRMDRIGIHDNFFELGGDSIISIQIVARANQSGLRLTPKHMFDHQTIAELAKVVGQSMASKGEQGLVSGEVAFLPIQSWFFEQELPTPHHWNQSMLVSVNRQLNTSLLEKAIAQLTAQHDTLRLRFTQTDGEWKQVHAEWSEQVPLRTVDLTQLALAEQTAEIERIAEETQASLNLADGPIFRIVHFDLGPEQKGRLLIVIHHLVVDGVSWRIILEDLQAAYEQAESTGKVQLAPKTTSYKQWAEECRAYVQSERVLPEQAYWLAACEDLATYQAPVYDHSLNLEGHSDTWKVELDAEETNELLQTIPTRYRTQINDVLLTALSLAHAEWSGQPSVLVHLEGHGREELSESTDLSRTVGWFTSMYPVLLDHKGEASPVDALRVIKEQLQSIPNKGIGYGLLRYLSPDAEVTARLKSIPHAPISFNYLGQFNQMDDEKALFGFASESRGANISPDAKRPHLIDVVSAVEEGKLIVSWIYNTQLLDSSRIEKLAAGYMEALRSIIRFDAQKQTFSAADFEDSDLSQASLNKVLSKLKKRKGK